MRGVKFIRTFRFFNLRSSSDEVLITESGQSKSCETISVIFFQKMEDYVTSEEDLTLSTTFRRILFQKKFKKLPIRKNNA